MCVRSDMRLSELDVYNIITGELIADCTHYRAHRSIGGTCAFEYMGQPDDRCMNFRG